MFKKFNKFFRKVFETSGTKESHKNQVLKNLAISGFNETTPRKSFFGITSSSNEEDKSSQLKEFENQIVSARDKKISEEEKIEAIKNEKIETGEVVELGEIVVANPTNDKKQKPKKSDEKKETQNLSPELDELRKSNIEKAEKKKIQKEKKVIEMKNYIISSKKYSSETSFRIPCRYSPVRILGRGSYGLVIEAYDTENDISVAIKKINLKALTSFDKYKDVYYTRTLREMMVLIHIGEHENCIELLDLIPPLDFEREDEYYIVTDLMETSMRKILNQGEVFSDEFIKYFIYKTLRALKYLHSGNVLHRDLKPGNLLINRELELKICDFGLARGLKKNEITESLVISDFYRPPELDLCWNVQLPSVDVFSVGCILAELMNESTNPYEKFLFKKQDALKRIDEIMDTIGPPKKEDIFGSKNGKSYLYNRINSRNCQKTDFAELFPNANPLAIDLLEKMIVWNPYKRISIDDALKHPYFKELYDIDKKDGYLDRKLPEFEHRFKQKKNKKLTFADLKKKIMKVIVLWNKEKNPKLEKYIVVGTEKKTLLDLQYDFKIKQTN